MSRLGKNMDINEEIISLYEEYKQNKGDEYISTALYYKLAKLVNLKLDSVEDTCNDTDITAFNDAVMEFLGKYDSTRGKPDHYFRYLYRINRINDVEIYFMIPFSYEVPVYSFPNVSDSYVIKNLRATERNWHKASRTINSEVDDERWYEIDVQIDGVSRKGYVNCDAVVDIPCNNTSFIINNGDEGKVDLLENLEDDSVSLEDDVISKFSGRELFLLALKNALDISRGIGDNLIRSRQENGNAFSKKEAKKIFFTESVTGYYKSEYSPSEEEQWNDINGPIFDAVWKEWAEFYLNNNQINSLLDIYESEYKNYSDYNSEDLRYIVEELNQSESYELLQEKIDNHVCLNVPIDEIIRVLFCSQKHQDINVKTIYTQLSRQKSEYIEIINKLKATQ